IGKNDDKVITHDTYRGIRSHFWAHNGRNVLYVQDKGGDENYHVYSVDTKTMDVKDLTPFENVRAMVTATDPNHPNEILVSINNRDPQLHDVYRVDLASGQRTLIEENTQGFLGYQADNNLDLRVAFKSDRAGGMLMMVRDNPDSAWRNFQKVGIEDALSTGPVGFAANNKTLYVTSSIGSNTSQLREVDLADGAERVIAYDETYDVGGTLIHPTKHHVQAVSFNRQRRTWDVVDKSVEADFAALAKVRDGDFSITDRDHADRTWIVAYTMDDGPVYYYAWDRPTQKATLLFSNRKELESVKLSKVKPVSFKADDGMKIYGYLTTPPGVEAKNLPTVLFVHGGPWYRDSWGYNPVIQWLANRGYAVLQVNFRGSTGYGKDYLNAADREWGGKMHQDLIDGVNWIVKKGIADPKKVAIMGGSYGGYATLVGMTFTPDVFCCGVDIVGPSNLITFMNTIPPYWKPWESIWFKRVGDPKTEPEFLMSRSPVTKIDRIKNPLLIGQGKNDPRVNVEESRQMVEGMKKAGKDVEYVEYADEGHGFARPENRLDFFAKSEKFLAKHLGGRYEQ
ncbi:MAG: alpha/beta fold hydrolase, partial [Phycisphaerae bacterium]